MNREELLLEVQTKRLALLLDPHVPTPEFQALVKRVREAGITSAEILEPLAPYFGERYEAINNALTRQVGRY